MDDWIKGHYGQQVNGLWGQIVWLFEWTLPLMVDTLENLVGAL